MSKSVVNERQRAVTRRADVFDFLENAFTGNLSQQTLRRFAEGFNEIGTTNYPPVNLVLEEYEDGILWRIQLAAAGFSREQLSINLKDNDTLIEISSKELENQVEEPEIKTTEIIRQIAQRPFKRVFTTTTPVDIQSAVYQDGLLTVVVTPKEPPEGKTITIV